MEEDVSDIQARRRFRPPARRQLLWRPCAFKGGISRWQLELNHGDLYTLLSALDNVQEQLDALA
jgi:hypothetical protein